MYIWNYVCNILLQKYWGTAYRTVPVFSKDLEDRTEDDSGWIFARGGDALIAYYPLAPYEWESDLDANENETGSDRLVSRYLKNGAVVMVAPFADHGSMEAFSAAVKDLPLNVSTEPTPSVEFTTLEGAKLSFTYGSTPSVDGTPLDYDNWPLYGGPFLNADRGSRKLHMQYGADHRLLDFEKVTVTDWKE